MTSKRKNAVGEHMTEEQVKANLPEAAKLDPVELALLVEMDSQPFAAKVDALIATATGVEKSAAATYLQIGGQVKDVVFEVMQWYHAKNEQIPSKTLKTNAFDYLRLKLNASGVWVNFSLAADIWALCEFCPECKTLPKNILEALTPMVTVNYNGQKPSPEWAEIKELRKEKDDKDNAARPTWEKIGKEIIAMVERKELKFGQKGLADLRQIKDDLLVKEYPALKDARDGAKNAREIKGRQRGFHSFLEVYRNAKTGTWNKNKMVKALYHLATGDSKSFLAHDDMVALAEIFSAAAERLAAEDENETTEPAQGQGEEHSRRSGTRAG